MWSAPTTLTSRCLRAPRCLRARATPRCHQPPQPHRQLSIPTPRYTSTVLHRHWHPCREPRAASSPSVRSSAAPSAAPLVPVLSLAVRQPAPLPLPLIPSARRYRRSRPRPAATPAFDSSSRASSPVGSMVARTRGAETTGRHAVHRLLHRSWSAALCCSLGLRWLHHWRRWRRGSRASPQGSAPALCGQLRNLPSHPAPASSAHGSQERTAAGEHSSGGGTAG